MSDKKVPQIVPMRASRVGQIAGLLLMSAGFSILSALDGADGFDASLTADIQLTLATVAWLFSGHTPKGGDPIRIVAPRWLDALWYACLAVAAGAWFAPPIEVGPGSLGCGILPIVTGVVLLIGATLRRR